MKGNANICRWSNTAYSSHTIIYLLLQITRKHYSKISILKRMLQNWNLEEMFPRYYMDSDVPNVQPPHTVIRTVTKGYNGCIRYWVSRIVLNKWNNKNHYISVFSFWSDCREFPMFAKHPTEECSYLECFETEEFNPLRRMRMVADEESCPLGKSTRSTYTYGTRMPCYRKNSQCLPRKLDTFYHLKMVIDVIIYILSINSNKKTFFKIFQKF